MKRTRKRRSRSRRDDGCGGRCLDLGLLHCGGSRCGLRGLSLRSGVLQRSNGGGLLNLRGVLLDLGRGVVLGLGLRLEELANASRQATADLGRLLLLFLLLLLLLLRSLGLRSGLSRSSLSSGGLSGGGSLGLLHGLGGRSLFSLGCLDGSLGRGLLGSLLGSGGGDLFLLLSLLSGLLLGLLLSLLLLVALEGGKELGEERGALGALLLLGLRGSLGGLGLLGGRSVSSGRLSGRGSVGSRGLSLSRGGSLDLGLLLGSLSSRRFGGSLGRRGGLDGGSLDRLGLLDGDDGGSDGVRHYGRLRGRENSGIWKRARALWPGDKEREREKER
ncbi:hypothetical protein C2E23DRAFT_806283 [Lenzites betulinus]|nr:hypothetical protein C2E23DRAFT_806283 [Lenzites betulinus]